MNIFPHLSFFKNPSYLVHSSDGMPSVLFVYRSRASFSLPCTLESLVVSCSYSTARSERSYWWVRLIAASACDFGTFRKTCMLHLTKCLCLSILACKFTNSYIIALWTCNLCTFAFAISCPASEDKSGARLSL
jgi:hypothetical protein